MSALDPPEDEEPCTADCALRLEAFHAGVQHLGERLGVTGMVVWARVGCEAGATHAGCPEYRHIEALEGAAQNLLELMEMVEAQPEGSA